MSRRAGRRQLRNNGQTAPAGADQKKDLTPTEIAFSALYPVDRTKVVCRICQKEVAEIPDHLEREHPGTKAADYLAEFKGAPLRPSIEVPKDDKVNRRVTPSQADKHPGGREGLLIERELDDSEQSGFRDDLVELKGKGYPVGQQLVDLAYCMTVQRRLVRKIESDRRTTQGKISSSEYHDQLRKLRADIATMLQQFEKARKEEKEDEKGIDIARQGMTDAEAYVMQNIGEFDMMCPSCQAPLTAPGLPHWALAPMIHETEKGPMKIYPVWSPELWRLILQRKIPLYVMAFTLRTSPEGLKYTCKMRGEEWPTWIVMEQEERELSVLIRQMEKEWEVRNSTIIQAPRAEPKVDTDEVAATAAAAPEVPEDERF